MSLLEIYKLAIKKKLVSVNPALATERHKDLDNGRDRVLSYAEERHSAK